MTKKQEKESRGVSLVLVPAAGPGLPATRSPLQELIDSFWAGKSDKTIKAYREDLLRMADWTGLGSIEALAQQVLKGSPGQAFTLAQGFKAYGLKERGWSPAYVNNHLAALRSLVKFARRAGMIVWALDVDDVQVEPYRDTRGPGLSGMAAVIMAANRQENRVVAARDVAILSLFATMALRRDEVVSLDLEHVDLVGRRLSVKRKKKTQRVWLTVPETTAETLRAWLTARGGTPGPLFLSYAVAARRGDQRLAESSVWWLVREYAKAAGLNTRPHGFRHAAVTEALELTNGNIRAAQLFAGHSNPATTTRYDDNRKDVAGDVAEQVAQALRREVERQGGGSHEH